MHMHQRVELQKHEYSLFLGFPNCHISAFAIVFLCDLVCEINLCSTQTWRTHIYKEPSRQICVVIRKLNLNQRSCLLPFHAQLRGPKRGGTTQAVAETVMSCSHLHLSQNGAAQAGATFWSLSQQAAQRSLLWSHSNLEQSNFNLIYQETKLEGWNDAGSVRKQPCQIWE